MKNRDFYKTNEEFLLYTRIMSVLNSDFLGLGDILYQQRLRVLSVNSFEKHCNLCQRFSSISSGMEKVESNFINDDLN